MNKNIFIYRYIIIGIVVASFFRAGNGMAQSVDKSRDLYFSGESPGRHSRPVSSVAGSEPDLYWEWNPQPRWLGGVNWGGATFFGSLDRGKNFFGSTLADSDYVEVEIRFSSTDTTLSQTYRRDLNYSATGVGVFRGTAWDISDTTNPRRLNICFVEDAGQKPPNHLWDPDVSSLGGREYLFIMASDYDGTGQTYNNTNWGPGADVLYGWWPRLESGHSFFQTDPATLRIRFAYIRNFRAIPSDGQLTLNWVFDQPDANHLNLYYGTQSPPGNLLATLPSSTSIFEHSGLNNNTTYFYRMEAVDATGNVRYISQEIAAQPGPVSQNMSLVGFWHQRQIYGDIWGYTDSTTGREYALMCVRPEGFSIIDISDSIPVEVGFANASTPDVDSKDVKVFDHYAILVNEAAPVQIFDLSDPTAPDSVSSISFGPLGIPEGAHNCYVDGHFLYIVGNHGTGGLLIYDISDPTNPVFTGSFQPYYYHDIYVRNDTAFAAAIFGQGIDILDVSDKSQPALIKNFNYPGSGAHNTWTTEDGQYLFVGDEIGSQGNHTRVFDIRDLNNIIKVADIIVDPNAITHNSYVRDDLLYIAHYTEGVRVFDVSDPSNPQEIGYYDTYVPQEYGFRGCWSVYPFFATEKLIASDMQTGLYVLKLDSAALRAGNEEKTVPESFKLAPNYPNPFNAVTTIEYELPVSARVNLSVYNIAGQLVQTLIDEDRGAGSYKVNWNAVGFGSGVYFYKIRAGGFEKVRKLILIK